MKKKHLLSTMMLILSSGMVVAGLTGCTGGDNSGIQAPDTLKDGINYAKNFPDAFRIGQTYDLTKLIITQNVKSWTVTTASKTITISGKKVTATAAGNYRLQFALVMKDGTNKTAQKSGKVLTEFQGEYYDTFGKVTNNYTATNVYSKADDTLARNEQLSILHNKNYIALGQMNTLADDYSGYVVAKDGYAYYFNCANGVVTAEPGRRNKDLSQTTDLGANWGLGVESFTEKTDGDGNTYLETAAMAQDQTNAAFAAFYEIFGVGNITNGSGTRYRYSDFGSIVAEIAEVDEEETWLFTFTPAAGKTASISFTVDNIGTSTLDALETYRATGEVPERPDYSALNGFVAAATEAKSYTVTGTSSFSDASLGYNLNTTAYVNETTYVTKVNTEKYSGLIYGFIMREDGLWQFGNFDSKGQATEMTASFITDKVTSLWDADNVFTMDGESFFGITVATLSDEMLDEGMNPSKVQRKTSETVIDQDNGVDSAAALTTLVLNFFPQYNSTFFMSIAEICYDNGGESLLSYVDSQFVIANDNSSMKFHNVLSYTNGDMVADVDFTDLGVDKVAEQLGDALDNVTWTKA